MSMKRKYFTPKNELESGKRFDTRRKKMKTILFDNKGNCVFGYIPFRHTLLQHL